MIFEKVSSPIGLYCIIISATLVFALPNLRNEKASNENQQSAPYALEQIDGPTDLASPGNKEAALEKDHIILPVEGANSQGLSNPDKKSAESALLDSAHSMVEESQEAPLDNAGSSSHSDVSKSKNLEPEDPSKQSADHELKAEPSVLKPLVAPPSPEEVDHAASKSEAISKPVVGDQSELSSHPTTITVSFANAKHEHKPQLPVTNSHLKKPAMGSLDFADSLAAGASASSISSDSSAPGSGAKSLVSPTVNSEDPPPELKLLKKTPSEQLDVLSPSQKVSDTSNLGSIPGIVNREYGHHSRTRITLGGGYVRDRLPPLVNPASSGYVDDKPEKPVAPLEKIKSTGSVSSESQVRAEVKQEELKRKNPTSTQPESVKDSASEGSKHNSRCPKAGAITMAHPNACDKYYLCNEGKLTEHTCPNGLMYGTRDQDVVREHCVHRWKADCGDKSIPNPISSPGCRWQYGIFNVQGSPKCSPDYYECYAGRYEVRKCSLDGQVYDDRTKSCQFAEMVGCTREVLPDFQCPMDDQANTYWPFPRYFLNEHAFVHCINDKPEIVRCPQGQRVDPEHLHCVPVVRKTN